MRAQALEKGEDVLPDQRGRSSRHVWRWLLVGVAGCLVAGVALLVTSMTLLNEDWLKQQFVTQARDAFDIELEIESLEFHPWQGEELKDWKAKGTEKLRGFLRNKELLRKDADDP